MEEKIRCSCGCSHEEHKEHLHEHHDHDEICSCGCDHDHHHEHHKDECSCACGHEHHHGHHHHDHHEGGCSCGCGHDHEHGGTIEREEVVPLIAALILFFGGILLPVPDVLKLVLYVGAYVISGWKVLLQAAKNIAGGRIFDETFLMAVASLGACLIGEFSEGAAVMLFYNIGELLQSYAVGRSRKSITDLMDVRPDTANLQQDDQIVSVPAEQVQIGQIIVVRAGEKIPLDGIVLEGTSQLDTAALTGESLPREIKEGETALAGCINLTGMLSIRVTKTFENSTASVILEVTEHAARNKAKTEQFITRFARYYTPVVVITAAVTAILPPMLGFGTWENYLYRALTFLVLSCPCALVISVPMGFFAGIGRASRQGILVKGGNYLEALNDVEVIAFDKTGTLTCGELTVMEICPVAMEPEQLLEVAVLAEAHSNHPIALSLKKEYGKQPQLNRVESVTELAGSGVKAKVDQRQVLAGNERLMQAQGVCVPTVDTIGTLVYVAVDGVYQGYLVIGDHPKETAKTTLLRLKKQGVRSMVMLTGDRLNIAKTVADALGIDRVCAELLPADKMYRIEEIIKERKDKKGRVLFVGDGMNDAPVLARADVGIAMGAIGSDAAIEAADVVIMDDDIMQVSNAIAIAKITRKIVIQNIVFAIGVKVFILTLSFFGYSSMWAAVFADVGVCILTILNSMRIMFQKLHI